jgi:hypothetical protein
MINQGIYEVKMWNGRIGILARDREDGLQDYLELKKEELPAVFSGHLDVGEHIAITWVSHMEPIDRPQMSRRMQLFLELEAERRKMYGAKSI